MGRRGLFLSFGVFVAIFSFDSRGAPPEVSLGEDGRLSVEVHLPQYSMGDVMNWSQVGVSGLWARANPHPDIPSLEVAMKDTGVDGMSVSFSVNLNELSQDWGPVRELTYPGSRRKLSLEGTPLVGHEVAINEHTSVYTALAGQQGVVGARGEIQLNGVSGYGQEVSMEVGGAFSVAGQDGHLLGEVFVWAWKNLDKLHIFMFISGEIIATDNLSIRRGGVE